MFHRYAPRNFVAHSTMPINRRRYGQGRPKRWLKISYFIRFVRGRGKCEECGAEHGKPHPRTGKKVKLHCAHLDHNPDNLSFFNLKSLCHVCHHHHDSRDNWRRRWYGETGKYYKQTMMPFMKNSG
ncbi:hypothetical protein [Fibrivirga algicola]|uniref:HNH endonuclease n=1 Tax=Fibrivirga algicola TaxID=2950420 RepID=A0ABX0QMS3_9BACT|nr:hypothetical protein [Fibrivirga algicola]NID13760.1 hypothetical protein [Fibrivirga algicola]